MTEVVGNVPAGESTPSAAPTGTGAVARGTTSVSDEVVEKIAGNAAREVPGVADLGGDVSRFFAHVKERVGLGEFGDDAGRGVSGKVENGTATINIVIVIEAGHVVSEVTDQVRARVVTALEQYGLQVAAVNVTVDDVELGDPAPAASWVPRVLRPLSDQGPFVLATRSASHKRSLIGG